MINASDTLDTAGLTTTQQGVIQYERALDIVEVEGWVEQQGQWLLVFGDPDRPARQQRHTAIPVARVVEVDFLGT